MRYDLTVAVASAFALLEAVTPNFPKTADLKGKAMKAWKVVLESEGVRPDDLANAVVAWIKTEKFMPTPSEILAKVQEVAPSFVISDPVVVGEEDGTVRLGSRRACQELGIAFKECSEVRRALPERPLSEGARKILEAVVE